MKHRVEIGTHFDKRTEEIDTIENIQFMDLAGCPRVRVTLDGRLEIAFDSGIGQVAVSPIAGNVIQVRLIV